MNYTANSSIMPPKRRFQVTPLTSKAILILSLYLLVIPSVSERYQSSTIHPIALAPVLRLSGGSTLEEERPLDPIDTDIIIETKTSKNNHHNHHDAVPIDGEDNLIVVVPPKKSPVFLSDRTRLLRRRRVASSLKEHIAELQNRSSACVDSIYKSLVERNNPSQFFSILTNTVSSASNRTGFALWKLYLLALLGSSVGFSMFLYFISVGYALGISLPLAVSLLHYNRLQSIDNNNQLLLSRGTMFHTLITVLWGIRSTIFFLWREYVSWPALHAKMVQVNEEQKPTMLVQVLCWLVYSAAYVAMLSPCTIRLDTTYSSSLLRASSESMTRGFFGTNSMALRLSPILQVIGLLLETIADYQKCQFKKKSTSKSSWCHQGLWKYSTHPNYAGEWIFWCGTVLGGLPFCRHVGHLALILAGLVFISTVLRGATISLDSRHFDKYGNLPEYNEFKSNYGVFGPRLDLWLKRVWLQHKGKMMIMDIAAGDAATDNETEEMLEGGGGGVEEEEDKLVES